eukprot:TRINITY_DN21352_c0_g1_i1.p1 TRINITY_DN21352_c0_g1~~TRINITY_DN21352_c0_g1_i1.p1  ORF type:complete len:267 (+),score=48.12 TRINITY_DN21352_c0_g1_i1:135-935(+)
MPAIEDLKPSFLNWEEDLRYTIIWFIIIFVIERTMIALRFFPEPKSNTRYFALHTIVNAYVVYEYLPDVIMTYADPSVAYLGPPNSRGMAAIMALHIYHICFYQPLAMVDWVHHIVMCAIMLPIAYMLSPGRMMGHGCFYASGLPGGIDYAMLVMVKLGWLTKMQEKEYNYYIQLWMRAPGCVFHAILTWTNFVDAWKRHEQDLPQRGPNAPEPYITPDTARFAVWIVILAFFWNGLYFLDRVIRSHERNLVMDELAAKKNGKKHE